MEKKFKILPPIMPNFVMIDLFGKESSFPIEEFTKEEAKEYGELLKQEFIKHWEAKILSI